MPCVPRPNPLFFTSNNWGNGCSVSRLTIVGRRSGKCANTKSIDLGTSSRAMRNGIADGLKQQFDACEELPPELVHLSRLLEARDDGMTISL